MTPVGFIENIRAESLRVIRTDQPEGDLRIDCDVEKGLVELAFQKLLRPAPRPDRLPNATDGRALLCLRVQEILPSGDDPGRIVAQLVHVDELHIFRSVRERILQPCQVLRYDRHHDRLTRSQPIIDERD